MRFHVVSLPHTHTTLEFSACAYTEKVRKFCIMMKQLGHCVFLYAGEHNEAPCDEHIPCISEDERAGAVGFWHYSHVPFNAKLPHWRAFNDRAVDAIRTRIGQRDFICLIGGTTQQTIADAFPNHMSVEFGVGYSGTFAKYRVFESYAWMHMVYGAQASDPFAADGQWFDAVIPGYLERERFPYVARKDDYCCFVGRLIERKGWRIAAEVCDATRRPLKLAGQGTPLGRGKYLGVLGPKERAELMAHAHACFTPTIYVEPFGNVAIEAMACGTPVICTDWGAFTETVIHDHTGFRCRTFQQFVDAVETAGKLNPAAIRAYALSNYSLEAVAPRYDEYFRRLLTLWDEGWYQRAA